MISAPARRFRLLTSDPLYVESPAPGYDKSTRAFAHAWRDVWRQIPLGDKRVILECWRRRGAELSVVLIARLPWSDARAMYDDRQLSLVFDARLGLCPQLCRTVIAHEIAHAYCYAIGRTYPPTSPDYYTDRVAHDWDERELDAVEIACCNWGFEETSEAAGFGDIWEIDCDLE